MTNETLEQQLINEVCHLNPLHDGECQVFFSPKFTDIIQSFREECEHDGACKIARLFFEQEQIVDSEILDQLKQHG